MFGSIASAWTSVQASSSRIIARVPAVSRSASTASAPVGPRAGAHLGDLAPAKGSKHSVGCSAKRLKCGELSTDELKINDSVAVLAPQKAVPPDEVTRVRRRDQEQGSPYRDMRVVRRLCIG